MSDYKELVNKKADELLADAKRIFELELNFREYVTTMLSEDSYRKAAKEYNEETQKIMLKIEETNKILEEIDDEVSGDNCYVSKEKMKELNIELGKIMRIMGLNSWWVIEYGDVSLDDKPIENLYKKIYDEHIEDAKKFLFHFINITNKVFNK